MPSDVVLALSDRMALVMRGIACYPTGFAFDLQTVPRFYWDDEDEDFTHDNLFSWRSRPRDVRPTLLRVGVAYSNGEKATTLDPFEFAMNDRESDNKLRPHIYVGGGGGGGGQWSYEFWVWPLPPPGPVTFACEWPALGIEETVRKIEGDRFRKAAAKAKPVF
jgi:hypothetical protein